MSASSAPKCSEAANPQSPRLAKPLPFHRAAAPHPEARRQTPPVEYPAAARALPANATCSPNPCRAVTCWPYSISSPTTKHSPSLLVSALHPPPSPASPATPAPAPRPHPPPSPPPPPPRHPPPP